MGPARGSPTSRTTIRSFLLCWTSLAGYPEKVTVDLGKEWMREFSDNLKMHSVLIDLAPLETPHIIGQCARHGGVWKDLWRRTVTDAQIKGEDEVEETASIMTPVKNELGRKE